jgi:hypothetical protein
MSDHFPTFTKMRNLGRMPWARRATERRLLRAALYLILFLTVGCRVVMLLTLPNPWTGMMMGYGVRGNMSGWMQNEGVMAQVAGWLMVSTRILIGPPETDGLVIILCLVGLAASARPPIDSVPTPKDQADS